MKKTLGLILILLLMFSLLGCSLKDDGLPEGNSSAEDERTYHAIYDRMDIENEKAYMDITVQDGKIAKVGYSYDDDAQEVHAQQQAVVDGFLIMPAHETRMDANLMDGEAEEEDL